MRLRLSLPEIMDSVKEEDPITVIERCNRSEETVAVEPESVTPFPIIFRCGRIGESFEMDSRKLNEIIRGVKYAEDAAVLAQLCEDAEVQVRRTDTDRIEPSSIQEGIRKLQATAHPDTLVVESDQKSNVLSSRDLANYFGVKTRAEWQGPESFFGLFDGLTCYSSPVIPDGRALVYEKHYAQLKVSKLNVIQDRGRIIVSYKLRAWFMDKRAAATIFYGSSK
jgi:hypothetical protein